MKKVIRKVDKKQGITQLTTVDERWYIREGKDPKTGNPTHQFVPSVTWITGYYPKGVGFMRWLADHGWDEAEAIKKEAGDKGSKVHKAVEDLLNGAEVKMEDKYLNHTKEIDEELTVTEYEAIESFQRWFDEIKPKVLQVETVVWNDEHGYAGTVDLIAEIDGEPWIIDLKTSKNIWPSMRMQLSAYKHAIKYKKEPKLAILQVGYTMNKKGFKFTEVDDVFPLFLATKEIWQHEASSQKPHQKDYPLSIKLNLNNEEEEVKEDDKVSKPKKEEI